MIIFWFSKVISFGATWPVVHLLRHDFYLQRRRQFKPKHTPVNDMTKRVQNKYGQKNELVHRSCFTWEYNLGLWLKCTVEKYKHKHWCMQKDELINRLYSLWDQSIGIWINCRGIEMQRQVYRGMSQCIVRLRCGMLVKFTTETYTYQDRYTIGWVMYRLPSVWD